jgi:hypothetical protein
MHNLSVGAMFKNEERAIEEWVEHYLHHGADHLYLIDDDSQDASAAILAPYVARGLATLFQERNHPYYLGRQHSLYNRYILPHVEQTHWLLMVDLDEFMWSPRSTDLYDVLAQLDDIAQIQVRHTLFGSAGRAAIPKAGIVESYTRRSRHSPTLEPGNLKYFVNSSRAAVSSLGVHSAQFAAKEGNTAPYYIMDETWFVLNHYCCQAKEFWRTIKCTRGDSDNYRVRTMHDFDLYDLNDVEDTRLLEQNRRSALEGNRL